MVNRIRNFFKKLKKKELHRQYVAGFNWAMSSYFIDGMTTSEIRNAVFKDAPGDDEYNVEFDQGVWRALHIIISHKEMKHELCKD